MKKLILFFLLFSLFSSFPLKILASKGEGSEELIEKILIKIKEKWKEEALPIYKKMWVWFKENVWTKVLPLLKTEYEKRRPEIKEEFKKKTEEIKRETPQFLEKIWNKFSSLLRR